MLLANGAPVESYRDDGNRWLFQNTNTGWDLPPKPPCAPVLTGGPTVDAVWGSGIKPSEFLKVFRNQQYRRERLGEETAAVGLGHAATPSVEVDGAESASISRIDQNFP